MAAKRKGSMPISIALSREAPKREGGTAFAMLCLGGYGMLHMALVFLVVGLIAALLGFTTIAGASIAIAKFLAGLFLLLFLVFLIIGLAAGRRLLN
jgi:uncharacterized membrane protein YtjA (UPF0391 family)